MFPYLVIGGTFGCLLFAIFALAVELARMFSIENDSPDNERRRPRSSATGVKS